ncbi:MAG: histidinol-phosphatase [Sporomusaceae bacterium]|nr:histidinol-phosphatase [Sporomusaceae bacterium]
MRIDYHMHFEYGSYDLEWVHNFFVHAQKRGIEEIGIAEHSHGFIEFKELYYDELVLDESPIGSYQRQWLGKNKFRYSLNDYFAFMALLKKKGYPVKTGLEVCNFRNHEQVRSILSQYPFDYLIGSVHFLNGWGFDFSSLQFVWDQYTLRDIYEWYASAAEDMSRAGIYDILGHPFNIRLFKHLPDFDVQPYLERVAKALQQAGMAIDVNTGTVYRYPIQEISPYPAFMEVAANYKIPIILSSDAHQPEDCGRFIAEAESYVKKFGYKQLLVFDRRQATPHPLSDSAD